VEQPEDGHRLGVAAARWLADLESVTIEPGLSDEELSDTESRFDISFADDHRAFLAEGLPTGGRWPDWRGGSGITQLLAQPVDGILFDVVENGYWHGSWGLRPDNPDEAVVLAGLQLSGVPRLIPVYGHRYLPMGRGTYGYPVLSVMQTDVVVAGADLEDYIAREFARSTDAAREQRDPPDFWSDLATPDPR
jgi:hypothetical protein